jgi:hypothetical protein
MQPCIHAVLAHGGIRCGANNLSPCLQDTVAITQNYVSAANLPSVLRHLQNPALVSGCSLAERATLHDRFVAALQQQKPEVRSVRHESSGF